MKIKNGKLVDGRIVDIAIESSKIKNIGELSLPVVGDEEIDATGLIVIPGVIDPHVHFRMPGGSHKEDWGHGSEAALRGGVTTVFDMPNTQPPLTTRERLEEKRKIINNSNPRVQALFWFGATPGNLDEIKAVKREPDVIGYKVFLSSASLDLLVIEDDDLRQIFKIAASSEKIVAIHPEDEGRIRRNRSICSYEPKISEHSVIRDVSVEVLAVRRVLRLAKETGCSVYFCHLSTSEAMELALEAKYAGRPVFIEVTPHHLTFDDEKLRGAKGGYFKMNPPLRDREEVDCLVEYVCRGYIDTIGSDHAPHTRQEKENTKYDEVPSGVPGVETLLPIMLNFVATGKLSMERLVSLTSTNAANIFGLASKGKIEPGYNADLVLIDPNHEWTIRNEGMATKCGWTPYDGMKVKGFPKVVIMGGKVVINR